MATSLIVRGEVDLRQGLQVRVRIPREEITQRHVQWIITIVETTCILIMEYAWLARTVLATQNVKVTHIPIVNRTVWRVK